MLEFFAQVNSNNKRALRDPFSFEIVRGYLFCFETAPLVFPECVGLFLATYARIAATRA